LSIDRRSSAALSGRLRRGDLHPASRSRGDPPGTVPSDSSSILRGARGGTAITRWPLSPLTQRRAHARAAARARESRELTACSQGAAKVLASNAWALLPARRPRSASTDADKSRSRRPAPASRALYPSPKHWSGRGRARIYEAAATVVTRSRLRALRICSSCPASAVLMTRRSRRVSLIARSWTTLTMATA